MKKKSMLYWPVKCCSSNVLNSKVCLEWDRSIAMSGRRRGLNGVWNRMGSPKPNSENLCQIYWSVPPGSSCLSELNQFLLPRSSTYKKDIQARSCIVYA